MLKDRSMSKRNVSDAIPLLPRENIQQAAMHIREQNLAEKSAQR
jgi:hypothetical protein